MQKANNTLAQLNENNFDILNDANMGMVKGGKKSNSCGNYKSKKSNKSKKSKKSRKSYYNPCNPCGW